MEHCDEVSVVRNNKISHIHVMYIPVIRIYKYIFFLSRAWISVALQRHVKSGGNERLGVPSPTFLFVRSCALQLWRHGESTLGAYARLIYSSLYMYDQHYPHSYYGSHTNKIAYSDLQFTGRDFWTRIHSLLPPFANFSQYRDLSAYVGKWHFWGIGKNLPTIWWNWENSII